MKKKVVIRVGAGALAFLLMGVPFFGKSKKASSGNSYSAKVLEVGDHDTKEIMFEDSYLDCCDRKNVDIAIVISPDEYTISDICDDVEYTKALIAKHNIGPVYFDIDSIMTNNDLTLNQKIYLIDTYLSKVKANGIYVGLAGTNTNLYNLGKAEFDVDSYDTYLTLDGNEDKRYEGTSSFISDENGMLEVVNYDIFDLVKELGYNNPDNFVQDMYYIVGDKADLDYVINSFNISMNDLLNYNGISYNELANGMILRIPNKTQPKRENSMNYYSVAKGIDVSEFQDKDSANWDKVKSNVDFMIIRATFGKSVDSSFADFYNKAMFYDIPIGVYSYSYAKTKDDMKLEAEFLIRQLQDKNVTYPVYLDLEDIDTCLQMDDEELLEAVRSWTEVVRRAGYIPGIYMNASTYCNLVYKFDKTQKGFLDQFDLWLAGSSYYDSEISINDAIDPNYLAKYNDILIPCNMRQVSSFCTDVGIGTESDHVDFNFCYTDYKYTVTRVFPIKNFNRIDIEEISVYTGLAIVGVLAFCGGVKIIIAKNKEKKIILQK